MRFSLSLPVPGSSRFSFQTVVTNEYNQLFLLRVCTCSHFLKTITNNFYGREFHSLITLFLKNLSLSLLLVTHLSSLLYLPLSVKVTSSAYSGLFLLSFPSSVDSSSTHTQFEREWQLLRGNPQAPGVALLATDLLTNWKSLLY